jgi:trehalose/maltose hydrolase-like predicted phosphorylase
MPSQWLHVFVGEDPADEGRREALSTLGNGYMGVRGAAPEHDDDGVHYPGTYVAGCFNRLRDSVQGHDLDLESIVNLPNWLPFRVRADDGDWLGADGMEVLEARRELDLRRGALTRRIRFRDRAGRVSLITQRRFVDLRHCNVCGLQTTVVPENWSGAITVRSEVNANTTNLGVERYRQLSGRHYACERLSAIDDESVLCVVGTSQSRVRIAVAARTRLPDRHLSREAESSVVTQPGRIGHELRVPVRQGQAVTIDKIVTIYTSRDRAVSEPAQAAAERLRELPDFDDLLETHTLAWRQVWRRFHFRISRAPARVLHSLRLDMFHVLQTLTSHSTDLDVGVPARGLHGEAYRGHVFWDELFVLRTLSVRAPHVCRALLLYRFRRLGAARRAAGELGKAGAMFPWQSGSDGREESQLIHLNPQSGRWIPDATARQRHVGLAVAYNTWQYWQATSDQQFLEQYGAEMIVEVARFFADLAEYDHQHDRFVIRGVVGPDEFHTAYPEANGPGIDNNAYTNIMAVWVLLRAIDCVRALPVDRRLELQETLGLRASEEHRWEDISRRMFVPFHDDGVISQFEGYERLTELDWEAVRAEHGDIRRLDRILEADGEDPNRFKLSKQADVLMLFYLLSADELGDLFDRLGYRLGSDVIPRTIDYYLSRTSHGSTLSAVVHAWVLARSRRERALEYFLQAVESDVTDVHGGTTEEGVHLGAMAGSIDVLERCFGGVETRHDALWLNPYWPPELGELEFDVSYRQHLLRLNITGASITVASIGGTRRPVRLRSRGVAVTLQPGETVELPGPAPNG